MTLPNCRSIDLPIFPAMLMALLCIGAAVHQNPTLLRPVLTAAQVLPHLR